MFYFNRSRGISPLYLQTKSYISGTSFTKVFSKLPWEPHADCWYILNNLRHTNYMDVLIGPTGDTLEVISKIQPYIKVSKWEI